MKVALGIPFWILGEHGSSERQTNYEWVANHVIGMYPWYKILVSGDTQTRGGARNALVREAEGCDVVVLCDADTFPEKQTLLNAIMGAQTHGGLHFAHDKFFGLNRTGTQQILMGGDPYERNNNGFRPVDYLIDNRELALGGVMAIRPDDWWSAHGSPELIGWGFEDVIFAVKARTLLSPNTHHPGSIYHLWHPTECRAGSESWNRNIAVCRDYEKADGNGPAILELEKKYGRMG